MKLQSLLLVEALENGKDDNAKVRAALVARGVTDDKLSKDWKKKSLFHLGRAEFFNQDFEDAVSHLKSALDIAGPDAKDVAEILEKAQVRLAQVRRKEKSMWSKAFKSNSEVHDDDDSVVLSGMDSPLARTPERVKTKPAASVSTSASISTSKSSNSNSSRSSSSSGAIIPSSSFFGSNSFMWILFTIIGGLGVGRLFVRFLQLRRSGK